MKQSFSNIQILVSVLILSVIAQVGQANVMPPPLMNFREKVQQSPGYFNMADQFCRKKSIGDRCVVPGTTLEGGGDGICEQYIDDKEELAIAKCTLIEKPFIDRQIRKSTFQLNEAACELYKRSNNFKARMESMDASCELAPIAKDRFCYELNEGDPCVASSVVGDQVAKNPGICRVTQEVESLGHGMSMARPVMMCEGIKPVKHTLKPVKPRVRLKPLQ